MNNAALVRSYNYYSYTKAPTPGPALLIKTELFENIKSTYNSWPRTTKVSDEEWLT